MNYSLKHIREADGLEIEFHPLSLLQVMGRFPELLNRAFPEQSAKRSNGVDRARKLALERAGLLDQPDEGLERTVALMVGVINLACAELRLYASWEAVPRDAAGAPLVGHFHHEQLGEDGPALFQAILEASGLGEVQLTPVRKLLENEDHVVFLDLIGQRYRTRPSELLGMAPSEPGGLALDLICMDEGSKFLAAQAIKR